MKIIVCEYLTAEGHANLFVNVCRLLVAGGFDVIAVVPKNFTKNIPFCEVKRMDIKYYSNEYSKSSSLNKILYSLRVQKRVSKLLKGSDTKACIVVTYDELGLAIGKIVGFVRGLTFVFHNLNPDAIIKSRLRRFAYDLIKDSIVGVVLAGFIKDVLVSKFRTNPEKVLVFPHPMNPVEKRETKDIDCIGLSNSNDENIIEKIINDEKKDSLIKKNNLKIILKSKKHKFDNGYLKIISGFIDDSIYDDYIARTKCIFIAFPTSFKYRISGNLIDALSNNKKIIGTNIPVIVNSRKTYEKVIKIYKETSFVKDVMETCTIDFQSEDDFYNFHEQHSDGKLTEILYKALRNAIDGKPMEDDYDF